MGGQIILGYSATVRSANHRLTYIDRVHDSMTLKEPLPFPFRWELCNGVSVAFDGLRNEHTANYLSAYLLPRLMRHFQVYCPTLNVYLDDRQH